MQRQDGKSGDPVSCGQSAPGRELASPMPVSTHGPEDIGGVLYAMRTRNDPQGMESLVGMVIGQNDAAAVRVVADGLVELAWDVGRPPCEINHDVTDVVSRVVRAHPSFLEPVAAAVARRLASRPQSQKAKNSLSEIISHLTWETWDQRERHFMHLLSKHLPTGELLTDLHECEAGFSMCVSRLGDYVDPPRLGADGRATLSPALDLDLERYSSELYFLEHQKRLVGHLEAFQTRGSNITQMHYNIFRRSDTGRGFGAEIAKFAAEWAGPGAFVGEIYPITTQKMAFLLRMEEKGIFAGLEGIYSGEAKMEDIRQDDAGWFKIASPQTSLHERGMKLFIRAKIPGERAR